MEGGNRIGSSSNPYWKDEIERYQRENEELREVLRRCGELAKSRKTGAIQHLVRKTLGQEHFDHLVR